MGADRPTSELLPARNDATTAVLSCWFTAGLFLDAWAHNNVPRLGAPLVQGGIGLLAGVLIGTTTRTTG